MFGRAATANATLAAINSRKVRLEIRLVGFFVNWIESLLITLVTLHYCTLTCILFYMYYFEINLLTDHLLNG